MANVLVTGGSGFIASWCIVSLLKQGHTVRTTIRNPAKAAAVRTAVAEQIEPGDRLTTCIADLLSDDGWDAAVAGCDYVLHVASPLATEKADDPNDLIIPAREGTLRVLRAAIRARVQRVVLTSSVAASSRRIDGPDSVNDETVWTDINDGKVNAYRQSKTLAERAAWDLIAKEGGQTELTTILPSAVLGPILSKDHLGSVQLVQRLLSGKMPGYPNLGFTIVDVRDVAELHVIAMTSEQAAGERFIAACEFRWMREVAQILREKLGERANKTPTRSMPNFLVRLGALFDPALRFVTPNLGRKHVASSAKAQRLLQWKPRDSVVTIVECAESLIARQVV
jgi:nucleoside-diphosphate-sugar epimerase